MMNKKLYGAGLLLLGLVLIGLSCVGCEAEAETPTREPPTRLIIRRMDQDYADRRILKFRDPDSAVTCYVLVNSHPYAGDQIHCVKW